MGLEKVKSKVIEAAKAKANSRLDDANAEAKKIAHEASTQSLQKEKALKKQIEEQAELISKREAASAKLESKKLSLAFRKDFIEGTFSEAEKKLDKLPDKKRAAHIKRLLEKAESEIEIGTVYCSKNDAKHVSGHKAKETDIIGGIIAESKDGSVRVDYSYETLLSQLKEEMLPELNKELFEK